MQDYRDAEKRKTLVARIVAWILVGVMVVFTFATAVSGILW